MEPLENTQKLVMNISNIPFIDNLYEENLDEQFILIKTMKKIKCSILESGLKPKKMKYFFCSCDPNKMNPICEECAKNCHKDHILSEPLEELNVCACGYKLHNISNETLNIEYKKDCQFFDIAKMSGRSVYYINEFNQTICMFCNIFCTKKNTMNCSFNRIEENKKISKMKIKIYGRNDEECIDPKSNNSINFDTNDINYLIKDEKNYNEININNKNKKIILNNKNLDMENHIDYPELNQCDCSHENHSSIKMILELTNYIGNLKDYFEDLNANQLLNILFISENIYSNNYRLFEEYSSRNFNFTGSNLKLDSNIHLTNYFNSLMNFYNISRFYEKNIRYTNDKICNIFNSNFLYNILNANLSDNVSNWSFYNCVLGIFHKCFLGNLLTKMTKFKIGDLENLSIIQRLYFLKFKYAEIKNVSRENFIFIRHYISNKNNNLINMILNFFENLLKVNFTCLEGLELILTIFTILYRFSSYYLFDIDQKLKLIYILEKCIKNFRIIIINYKKSNKLEIVKTTLAKIFVKIIKTIIFLAYEENDTIIYNEFFKLNNDNNSKYEDYLLDKDRYNSIRFFHMKNDFGISVSKILIQILDLSRKEFEDFEKWKISENIRSIINDVFRYQNHLLSIFFRPKDSYTVGLRSFFCNHGVYFKLIQQKGDISFNVGNTIESMEHIYHQYMNLKCDKKELINTVSDVVNDLTQKFIETENINPG